MSKTIKQISEELGVTKQAIHQRLKRNVDLKNSLKPFMKTVDGVIHVEVGGQNLLKEAFIKPINKYDVTDNKSNVTDNKSNVTDNKSNVTDNKDNVTDNKDNVTDNKDNVTDNKSNVTDNKGNVTDNKGNVTDNTSQPVITILEATIKTLQEQLSVKDKQIENLTTTLQDSQETQRNLAEALNSAQALHAGTIRQQLTTTSQEDTQDIINKPEQKQSFLSKIFKKGKWDLSGKNSLKNNFNKKTAFY